jgi:hypothetical protein
VPGIGTNTGAGRRRLRQQGNLGAEQEEPVATQPAAERCDAGRVCGITWVERFTRISPLVLCGFVCMLVGVGGTS